MEKTIKMAYNPLFAEINIKPTPLNGLPRKRRIRDIMLVYDGMQAIRWAEETACFLLLFARRFLFFISKRGEKQEEIWHA